MKKSQLLVKKSQLLVKKSQLLVKKSKLLVSRGMSDMDLFALLATIRGVHNDISGINSHFLLDSQPLDGVNMHTKQYTHRSLLFLLFVFPSRVVSTSIVCDDYD